MLYITGDTHGNYPDFVRRMENAGAGRGDTALICVDFGFIWPDEESREGLEKLKKLPYTVAWIDGNHEDFDTLYEYPTEDWCGGKVHRISDNIVHLMRGECFIIEGRSFFCMGGAYSVDKARRCEHYSWWRQEQPDNEEYTHARKTLERLGYKVDYVLTHTVPESFIHRLGLIPDRHDAQLTGYFEWLYRELDFRQWFAGHFHEDRDFGNFRILYESVVTL